MSLVDDTEAAGPDSADLLVREGDDDPAVTGGVPGSPRPADISPSAPPAGTATPSPSMLTASMCARGSTGSAWARAGSMETTPSMVGNHTRPSRPA